ncbi:tetratricopeptide repeat protein 28-like [Oculina patagonica]
MWVLKTSGEIHFRRVAVNENIIGAILIFNFDDFLAKTFRAFRLVDDDDEECKDPESSLSLCYKMIIVPVADLLEGSEIIIVPDRFLYQVPFAALSSENGKYFSETFKIRIVPSLSTLKLIQDSPADYHSQTGALIVGDPVVSRVRYMGRVKNFTPLPFARKEAEVIGELLGVQPLLGQNATKHAVLEIIHSVSLVHLAAHGNAERGEVALSPRPAINRIPKEEDYLLTMSDISRVHLRAKLVVLSCCHSGSGQIRAEGVVEIARAFLGSGARSVLVTLWALEDIATEQFMSRFYKHLVSGESASQSLNEAMKWMRGNGYSDVRQWATFMLIGDNVTFDFSKVKGKRPGQWRSPVRRKACKVDQD